MDSPTIWAGHIMLMSSDPAALVPFYEKLGMVRIALDPGAAVLALRGGTHLVILKNPHASAAPAKFDLMVAKHDEVRTSWASMGIPVSQITVNEKNGHRVFTITDPEGNTVIVNNSHVPGED